MKAPKAPSVGDQLTKPSVDPNALTPWQQAVAGPERDALGRTLVTGPGPNQAPAAPLAWSPHQVSPTLPPARPPTTIDEVHRYIQDEINKRRTR
jgi:hypothetical protein